MLDSASELEFSEEKATEDPSQLSSLELSGGTASSGKNAAGLPEKTGYPDSVYVMAANIFQGIRVEKSPGKVLIKYGNEPLPYSTEFEDESFQRLSYELAFSALKYQDILESILIDSYIFPSTTIPDHLNGLIIVMLYDFQDRKFQGRLLSDNEESIAEVLEVENLLNRLSPPVLPLCSLKEIHLSTDKFFRMEPSEITNGCFLSVLTRERDPSETVSVKDVLARAAAKGLLDGIELGKPSKREKKKKKSKTPLPKAPTADNNSVQMKIAEFLSRETNANANRRPQPWL
ncbi:hypothetical protein CB1_001141004 [Camelus ferus]|nr:hypothetical protein CB1_001141004 [Camelus ferus]